MMSSHPNECNEGRLISASAVDFEKSVPVAEPDTLKAKSHVQDSVPAVLLPCYDRGMLLEFNSVEESPSRKSAW